MFHSSYRLPVGISLILLPCDQVAMASVSWLYVIQWLCFEQSNSAWLRLSIGRQWRAAQLVALKTDRVDHITSGRPCRGMGSRLEPDIPAAWFGGPRANGTLSRRKPIQPPILVGRL